MQVSAALPHHHKVMNHRHSVQLPLLRIFLHFPLVVCVRGIQFCVSASQSSGVRPSELTNTGFLTLGLTYGF